MTRRRQVLRMLAASPFAIATLSQEGVANTSSGEFAVVSDASTTEAIQVEAKLGELMGSIPTEESERTELVMQAAEKSCGGQKEVLNVVDLDMIVDETAVSKNALGLSKNVLSHAEDVFSTSLPIEYIDEVSNVARFVPFFSAFQNYLEICCEIQALEDSKKLPDKLEDVYMALFLVVAELVLLPSSVGYRSAFVGTRYVANFGLVRIRDLVGLRAYSVLLSGVHWGFRGTIEGTISYIIEKTAETVAKVDLEGITEIDESDIDYEFLDEAEEEEEGWLDSLLSDDEEDRDDLIEGLREHEETDTPDETDSNDEEGGWWPF